jgi:glutamate-ammonia-ligase adenylyltransferase
MALTRARPIFSTGGFGRVVAEAVRELLVPPLPPDALAREVVGMRRKQEGAIGRHALKRGCGGIADIEFLVHFLQLAHGAIFPDILRPNLWDALDALRHAGLLAPEAHADLRDAYEFWRTVESRLRIVHNRPGADLPDNPDELARLARRLNYDDPNPSASCASFLADSARHAARARSLFDQVVGQVAGLAACP